MTAYVRGVPVTAAGIGERAPDVEMLLHQREELKGALVASRKRTPHDRDMFGGALVKGQKYRVRAWWHTRPGSDSWLELEFYAPRDVND